MQVKPTNKHEMKAKLEPERGVWEGVDREKESFLCTLYENRKKKKTYYRQFSVICSLKINGPEPD